MVDLRRWVDALCGGGSLVFGDPFNIHEMIVLNSLASFLAWFCQIFNVTIFYLFIPSVSVVCMRKKKRKGKVK